MSQESDQIASSRPKHNHIPRGITPDREKELLEAFHYDPSTGIVTWKKDGGRWGEFKAGSEAGSTNGVGRRVLAWKGIPIKTPRFAFFFMTGKWSSADCIDHVDGNPLNNRFCNLREATCAENSRNRRTCKNTIVGLKGVVYIRRPGFCKRFEARIRVHGRTHRLGVFNTPEEANEAYLSAAMFLHGEFVNLD